MDRSVRSLLVKSAVGSGSGRHLFGLTADGSEPALALGCAQNSMFSSSPQNEIRPVRLFSFPVITIPYCLRGPRLFPIEFHSGNCLFATVIKMVSDISQLRITLLFFSPPLKYLQIFRPCDALHVALGLRGIELNSARVKFTGFH